MVVIKEVSAKSIKDSRGEKTISVSIKTNVGNFSASAPNGKSTGKNAVKIYKKNLEGDISTLKKFSDYFSGENIEKFDDLRRVEDIVDRHIGANTIFALESAILKAIASEQKKDVWEVVNPSHDFLSKTRKPKFPRLVGNCVGGGEHSSSAPQAYPDKSSKKISTGDNKKPDFQEFLLIPNLKSVKENYERNKKLKSMVKDFLQEADEKFKKKTTDENAWMSSLNEREVLDVLKKVKVPLGVDIAASGFFKRKVYYYKNPMLKRNSEEQLNYLGNLVKNLDVFYIEDPFHEEDFESFAKLLKKFPDKLIVGDDLIVTSVKRLKKAIEMNSINAVIVKPNQCGSLLEVAEVCELAKENNIKIVFSHRSGETEETILADLAFGFQADFFKCGIDGKVREVKLKRLIEIEKGLK